MADAVPQVGVELVAHRPVGAEDGQGNDDDSCIAFSSTVISRSSSSARCIGLVVVDAVADPPAGACVTDDVVTLEFSGVSAEGRPGRFTRVKCSQGAPSVRAAATAAAREETPSLR